MWKTDVLGFVSPSQENPPWMHLCVGMLRSKGTLRNEGGSEKQNSGPWQIKHTASLKTQRGGWKEPQTNRATLRHPVMRPTQTGGHVTTGATLSFPVFIWFTQWSQSYLCYSDEHDEEGRRPAGGPPQKLSPRVEKQWFVVHSLAVCPSGHFPF